ncbi:MAG: SDR family NAD(P)-dependent oxidoreductase [Bacteroidales bacterium]
MEKISIVTGAASGLGFALAENLAGSGRKVLMIGRDKARLEAAKSRLQNRFGDSVVSFGCNIGIEAEVEKLAGFLGENNLIPEYLFNNAGRGLFQDARLTTSDQIDQIFEANLKGLILMSTMVLRFTPETEELTIVNIMSTSATLGRNEESVYCAAKWGARGYTEALRTELKGRQRNIIAVYPGGMKTDFWKVTSHDRNIESFMEPAEVADKITGAILGSKGLCVTDITINRR